ncbi:C40 family peptidase [Saccharopolyspora shandongensis]|uniref:C40 family peptidase n=1 Tax=Saccharopolyspora shandongensis TaxID=418495 RepID=UPI003417AB2C
MRRYKQLSEDASKANEDVLVAQDELDRKRAELDAAKAQVAAARSVEQQSRADEARLRGRVDELAGAAYRGSRLNGLSALLASENPDAFLDRATALEVMAADNGEVLSSYARASASAAEARGTAESAELRAQEAADTAARLLEDVRNRKRDLDKQVGDLREAMNELSSEEKAGLKGPVDSGSYLGPPGAANTALQAALSKRGSEYVWGSKGPGTFDCSGLTYWAYKQAGITIPGNSRAQWGVGRPVSKDQLQPGDLIFFDDGSGNPSKIHHVGMYVGGGKMIDAPTEGQLVDVRSAKGDGHYIGARRIVG